MSRTRSPRAALLTGALVGALALTGCGAGQVASTARQESAVSGANVEVGPIAVRDAVIVFGEQVEGDAVYPAGGEAPLSMTIVNEGAEADRLVSATTPFAASVRVTGAEVPPGRSVVIEGDIQEAGALAPEGTPTIAPNTTPQPAFGGQVTLVGLVENIRAGISYPVVLTFERAGDVLVQVPVGDAAAPRGGADAGVE